MNATLIGFGRFGQFFYKFFKDDFRFSIIDKAKTEKEIIKITGQKFSLQFEISQSDFIFLTIPISEIKNVALELKNFLSPNIVIVEFCSVKVYPLKILRKYFPKNKIVGLHPLFGPDSVDESLEGHQLIIADKIHYSKKIRFLIKKFSEKGIKLIKMSAVEHDKLMAYTLNLTQFIGRSLGKIHLPDTGIGTKGYFDLISLVNRTNRDTLQLFLDMNKFNPYSRKMRKDVIQSFLETEKMIRNFVK